MHLYKLTCSYISLHAGPLACMQFPELTWSSISLHEVWWACMQFLDLTWSSMTLHEVLWICVQFHELVFSSFLRLSSSQEFRSACCSDVVLQFCSYAVLFWFSAMLLQWYVAAMLHYYDISIQGQKDRQTDMKCYGFNDTMNNECSLWYFSTRTDRQG